MFRIDNSPPSENVHLSQQLASVHWLCMGSTYAENSQRFWCERTFRAIIATRPPSSPFATQLHFCNNTTIKRKEKSQLSFRQEVTTPTSRVGLNTSPRQPSIVGCWRHFRPIKTSADLQLCRRSSFGVGRHRLGLNPRGEAVTWFTGFDFVKTRTVFFCGCLVARRVSHLLNIDKQKRTPKTPGGRRRYLNSITAGQVKNKKQVSRDGGEKLLVKIQLSGGGFLWKKTFFLIKFAT